jgi:ADP-heptose:LPS heptosyltransferase
MKLDTKLRVDRIVGSLLVWLLLSVTRRRQQAATHAITPDHIVLLKLLGLGSIVQATPLVAALRNRFPHAEFSFVTRKGNDALTHRIALINRTLTVDDSSLLAVARSLWGTLKAVRAMRNVCFVNLEAYSRLGVLMTLLGRARWTAGFFRNPADYKLDRLFDVLVYFNQGAPISQVYLQLGRAMGCADLAPSLAPLTIRDSDEKEVEALFAQEPASEGLVVLINPNASELRLERRWPCERFSQLISELLQALPSCRIMLIGAPHERSYAESIRKGVDPQLHSRVRNTAGELSLGGLICLIKRARLLITNDSGPMHIAFSIGTPTVALFGPVEPAHYAFAGDSPTEKSRYAILYHRVYCSPCVHHFDIAPCRGNNVCMQRIEQADVLRASLSLLRDGRITPSSTPSIVYMDRGKALGVLR